MSEARMPAQLPAEMRWVEPFGIVSLLLLAATQALAILQSPADAAMGHLQKIMYIHVPTAWVGMLAFFAVFVLSIMYLATKRVRYDLLAAATTEVGIVMTALTLALGAIWGRPTWGVWWTWEPRLTSTAIMLLIYVGYLVLRGFAEDEERRARWSAAVGIIAFLNVPIVFWSVKWWRSLHQPQSTRESMSGTYWNWLWINAVVMMLVGIYFIALRYRAARIERAAELKLENAALGRSEVHA
ncbi:MAG TPA: cytochrome c biogenesis protein CcsA [Longimicrobiales bacterium]